MSWEREILGEALAALLVHWGWVVGAFALAVALGGVEVWVRRWRGGGVVFWLALLAATAYGLSLGLRVAWLCDDAFITFRYADNFARGLGLVFNPGEWVEGYTNFLWTLLLGLGGKLGLDIPISGLVLNLAAFVIALGASAACVRAASPTGTCVPFAALALAGSVAFTTFATSGLETMPAAMLVCLALWASCWRRGSAPLLSAVLLVAATLTRPDHVLYGVAMGAALVAEGLCCASGRPWHRVPWRKLSLFLVPWLLVLVPYWLIRWRVYGDFFPNPYYAKSADLAYWSQGRVYVTHFLCTSGAWLAVPLLLLVSLGSPRTGDEARLRAMGLGSTLLVGFYVARVGGDFMEHRFFVALLPVILVSLEVSLRGALAASRGLGRASLALAGALCFALTSTPLRLIGPGEKRWHLADESSFYRIISLRPLRVDNRLFRQSQALRDAFTGHLRPRLVFGCVGFVGYYSRLSILDSYGLTSRSVARKPLVARDRPGHEKRADLEDALADGAVLADTLQWSDFEPETAAGLPATPLWFVHWDEVVAGQLRRSGGEAPDVERDIARYADASDRSTALRAMGFYERFLAFDFRRNERLGALERRLAGVADFEDGLPPGASISGFVVRSGPGPRGVSGTRWLASEETGRFALELPEGSSAPLRFELGGGRSPGLRVQLVDGDGRAWLEATPGGRVQTVEWRVPADAAGPLTLVATDDDPSSGAELWIDAVRRVPVDEAERLARMARMEPRSFVDALRQIERELATGASPAILDSRVACRFRFDAEEWEDGVEVQGLAFHAPVRALLPPHPAATDFVGERFAASQFGGDGRTGTLRFRLPASTSTSTSIAVSALVGGSADCARAALVLRVGGREVNRACGQGDARLRAVFLAAEVPAGQAAELWAVDEATTAGGHFLLDDVIVMTDASPALETDRTPSRTPSSSGRRGSR